MTELLTAEKARERFLVPTQTADDELGLVLKKIEKHCYLQLGIHWTSPLSDEVIKKLQELGYTVLDVSIGGAPAYMIEWK